MGRRSVWGLFLSLFVERGIDTVLVLVAAGFVAAHLAKSRKLAHVVTTIVGYYVLSLLLWLSLIGLAGLR